MENIGLTKSQTLLPIEPNITGIEKVNEFLQFVAWTALPQGYKEPAIQRDLASKLGVDPTTLSDWKKHPLFWHLVWRQFKEWSHERTPNVMAAFYKKTIEEADAPRVKLWAQLMEDWKETERLEEAKIIKHVIITRGEKSGAGFVSRSADPMAPESN